MGLEKFLDLVYIWVRKGRGGKVNERKGSQGVLAEVPLFSLIGLKLFLSPQAATQFTLCVSKPSCILFNARKLTVLSPRRIFGS